MLPSGPDKTSLGEALRALFYALILFWVNDYIARDLFYGSPHHMGSMHGFWTAIAARAGGSWFHAAWWPFWEAGMPFEYTYPPLVPGLAAAIAALRGVSAGIGFQSVTGLCYILGPLTLFFAAWRLTRAPGTCFAAALAYSTTSVSRILVPEAGYNLKNIRDSRRLFAMAVWDDTPHIAALTLLPLVMLFLARSIQTRRPIYYAATAASIAGCALASAFGPVMVVMAALCLLFALGRERWFSNLLLTTAIGAWGWAIAAPFLSPSFMAIIRRANAALPDEGWNMGSITAIAFTLLGWLLLAHYLPRWTPDWRLRFFALFAWLVSSIPLGQQLLQDHFLPQPNRYRFEMELAACLVAVFAVRPWWQRIPTPVRRAAAVLMLALVAEQVRDFRRAEKQYTFPIDLAGTIEYRAATWAQQHYPQIRFFMPGSVAQWTNTFTEIQQYTGESFTLATNLVLQRAYLAIAFGSGLTQEELRMTLAWIKAYGVGAIGVSGKDSQEFWKGFTRPEKFEGLLPALWTEGGVTIYRVPLREFTLAHIVPESAIVRHASEDPDDSAEVEKYVAGLDDPSLPGTSFDWEGRNRIRIRTTVSPGNVLTVQESYHPGWHATIAGKAQKIFKDGLGLMWLRPSCQGPCEVVLDYDGGWELRLCRWLSWLAIAALPIVPAVFRSPPELLKHLPPPYQSRTHPPESNWNPNAVLRHGQAMGTVGILMLPATGSSSSTRSEAWAVWAP